MSKWEVVIQTEIVLCVEASDEEEARDLGGDSLSPLYVLDSWLDCVEEVDQWWSVDSVEPYVKAQNSTTIEGQ